MSQPSLFSAQLLPPELSDLGGLLAGSGQALTDAHGSRLSILLDDDWRAAALVAECRARGIAAEAVDVSASAVLATNRAAFPVGGPDMNTPSGTVLVRTELTPALDRLVSAWTRGAVKGVPSGLSVTVGFLRVWALATGRMEPTGYTLGLDPHAPDTHQDLAAAVARCGVAMAPVGVNSSAPVLRATGRRRLIRLLEMVGDAPVGAPSAAWPRVDR